MSLYKDTYDTGMIHFSAIWLHLHLISAKKMFYEIVMKYFLATQLVNFNRQNAAKSLMLGASPLTSQRGWSAQENREKSEWREKD